MTLISAVFLLAYLFDSMAAIEFEEFVKLSLFAVAIALADWRLTLTVTMAAIVVTTDKIQK